LGLLYVVAEGEFRKREAVGFSFDELRPWAEIMDVRRL
jgi:hypothetical protein